jgi:hypothetical protein
MPIGQLTNLSKPAVRKKGCTRTIDSGEAFLPQGGQAGAVLTAPLALVFQTPALGFAWHGMPMPMPMPLQISSHNYSNIMTITSLLGIANNNKRRKVQPTLYSFFGGGTLRIAKAFNAEGGM